MTPKRGKKDLVIKRTTDIKQTELKQPVKGEIPLGGERKPPQESRGLEFKESSKKERKLKDQGSKPNQGSHDRGNGCLLYTSPSPRDATLARMPSSA